MHRNGGSAVAYTNIGDGVTLLTGVSTAGVGVELTLNLTTMSEVMGIIAAVVGTICTILLTYWRYKDHKRRGKK